MNRTIRQTSIKAFHYADLESLNVHVLTFVCAFNFAKHLKALRWKTPCQTIVDAWQKNPSYIQNRFPSPHPGTKHLAGCGNSSFQIGCDLIRCFIGTEVDFMRGADRQTGAMFSYLSPETMVPLEVARFVATAFRFR